MNLGELHADVGGLGSGLADLGSRGGERGAHHGAAVDYCFDNPTATLGEWQSATSPKPASKQLTRGRGSIVWFFRNFWGLSVPVKS
jgi:hypothetical protein